jgi:hypothetical protein
MLKGTVVWLFVMPVASGPVSAIFLILASASVAVAVSMVVLALFDRAFPKKNPPVAKNAPDAKSDEPVRSPKAGSRKLKPMCSAPLRYQSKAGYQSGCGPQSQRVRNIG